MKIIWIDTEDTGLEPTEHEIVQLSGIIEIDKVVKEEFNFKCRPQQPHKISQEALKVMNTTEEELMSRPCPRKMWQVFIEMLDEYVDKFDKKDKLIPAGHNIDFDIRFLAETAKRRNFDYLFSYLDYHKIDTLAMAMIARLLGRLPTKNLKLGTLMEYFEIKPEGELHDSLTDIRGTRLVAQKLLRLIAGKQ